MTTNRVKEPPLRSGGAHSAKPPDSFAEVVEAHWAATYKLLHYLTRSPHDAEDLTQETFLRALRHWERFKHGTNLRAWLLRIATNAFFDLKRRKRMWKLGPLSEKIESRERPAGAAMEDREEAELVRTAMQGLSEMARMVIHLRVTENLSFKKIAGLAGISEVAARQYMYLARKALLKNSAILPLRVHHKLRRAKVWIKGVRDTIKKNRSRHRVGS